MKISLPLVSATLAAALLAGCASPEPGSPAAVALAAQKREEAKAKAVEATVDELPGWFASPPNDEHSLYAGGTATSSDLQLAMDKAVLNAKRSIADRLKGVLSSKMKQFVSESGAEGDVQVIGELERATSNLITEANLAGYAVTQSKAMPAGGQYRAYVLVQYPLGAANRVLADQVKKNAVLDARLRSSKAFQELEEDIRKNAAKN